MLQRTTCPLSFNENNSNAFENSAQPPLQGLEHKELSSTQDILNKIADNAGNLGEGLGVILGKVAHKMLPQSFTTKHQQKDEKVVLENAVSHTSQSPDNDPKQSICPNSMRKYSLSTTESEPLTWRNVFERLGQEKVYDLCQTFFTQSLCEGNLGISRDKMPQLNKTSMLNIATELSQKGYYVTYMRVSPKSLTPVQNQLNSKVILKLSLLAQQGQFDPCNDYILVSHDTEERKSYIIDGHHRAISCLLIRREQNAIIVDVKPIALLDILNKHPEVTHDETFLRDGPRHHLP